MAATFFSYGTTYTPETTFTASGTILAAFPQSRAEIDHLRVNVVSLDPGGSIEIGYGATSNNPSVFYTETSNAQPYDQHFDQPGIGNYNTANQAVTITITGGNAKVRVKMGYHLVPVTMIPASQQAAPGTQQ